MTTICLLQVNSLDENELTAKPITRNKLKNLFVALLAVAVTLLSGPTIYSKKMDRPQMLFYITYGVSLLSTNIEVLLIAEITERIKSKFANLNSKLSSKKCCTIFPFNAQPTMEQLNKITNVHYDLIVTSKQLNSTFGFSIVAITANSFYLAVEFLYYSLQLAAVPRNLEATFQMVSTSIWTLVVLAQILIIVRGFTELAEEVMAKYLHYP